MMRVMTEAGFSRLYAIAESAAFGGSRHSIVPLL